LYNIQDMSFTNLIEITNAIYRWIANFVIRSISYNNLDFPVDSKPRWGMG